MSFWPFKKEEKPNPLPSEAREALTKLVADRPAEGTFRIVELGSGQFELHRLTYKLGHGSRRGNYVWKVLSSNKDLQRVQEFKANLIECEQVEKERAEHQRKLETIVRIVE